MKPTSEISALLNLIDDPDHDVFDTVSQRIIDYGKPIIPNLEHLWEQTTDEVLQERIEVLIHRVHFSDLVRDFDRWAKKGQPELIDGALMMARYNYPELTRDLIVAQFEQMRRNAWLELNYYLTPLETINVVNSIFYNYYKFEGHELQPGQNHYFFINQVLESKQGNSYSLALLYLSLCELLDIPVFAVDVPRQFLMAYFDNLQHFMQPDGETTRKIQFFIDPLNGMIYTQNDVDVYLSKLKVEKTEEMFEPLNNREAMQRCLKALLANLDTEKEEYKLRELEMLIQLLNRRNNEKNGKIE